MKKNIVTYLQELPDERRTAGMRHNQTIILMIVLMSTMSGYRGYRAIGDFIQKNRKGLLDYLQPLKSRLPSFDTVRRVLQELDFDLLSKQFHQWAIQYVAIGAEEWISIDGKSIQGTMSDYHEEKQRFINLVSLYCSKQNLVIGNGHVDNSKESEIPVVRQLIEALDIEGVTFTLDALHCQKKRPE
jgi:hypothetical protein